MFLNEPVKIPEGKGIVRRTVKDTTYILYQVGREYDPATKRTQKKRVGIGIQIESLPGMMLPNENYMLYFGEAGAENSSGTEGAARAAEVVAAWSARKKRFTMLRDLFDRIYYEFQAQARKEPGARVSAYTAKMINDVLGPLKDMMKGEEYADFLGLIQEGENGHSYGEAVLIMSQYKAAMVYYQNLIR